jgi:hypothetical protein
MVDYLSFFSTNSANGFKEWCFVLVEKWSNPGADRHDNPFPFNNLTEPVITIDQWHVCNNQSSASPDAHPVETRVKYDNSTLTLTFEQTWFCQDPSTGRR